MSYSEAIFQKELYDLTIEDLISFFSIEQEETSVLEFKSGDVELDKLYREVAAFLNTEGGLLIIGSPKEEKKQNSNKVAQGDLTPSFKIRNQDALLMSIAANISPAPNDIRAKEFSYKGGKVFVLDIKQSVNPPHQVSTEGKYYIRLEREAKPAPHGIVEALFRKRQKPSLNLEVYHYRSNSDHFVHYLEFEFSNNSFETAENLGCIIMIAGLSEIVDYDGKRDVEFKDGILHYQLHSKDFILVKGLRNTIRFGVIFKYSVIFYECQYWCKGVESAHTMQAL